MQKLSAILKEKNYKNFRNAFLFKEILLTFYYQICPEGGGK